MEHYQAIQNRTAQTVAVITLHLPSLTLGGMDAAGLLARSAALNGLAQSRDDALADLDVAANAENQGFLQIRNLTLALPKSVAGELDATVETEAGLLDLLAPVYALVPRTTKLALDRAMKLKSALDKINPYLAAQVPARGPITSGGRGAAELAALIAAQPVLGPAQDDAASTVSTARGALRTATAALDRWNKRFYAKLQAEARTNETLAGAMDQIATDSVNLPGTLGIKSIVQDAEAPTHLRVTYEPGRFKEEVTNAVEWQVAGTDVDWAHSVPAEAGGNSLGPFAVGQVVRIRSRVTNGNGTTTGSVRTITVQPAPT